MDENWIVRKIRSRDPAGLERMMNRYIPYVSAIVWNILRGSMTHEDAEEVVSDVFVAAWNQPDDLQPGFLKSWLAAVARNKAKNKLRQCGFTLSLEDDILDIPDEYEPINLLEKEEEADLVRKAVDSLREPDREIFLRHYYYAQTVREISMEMRLNESTVKTKLRRGRARLRAILLRWGVA